MMTLEQPQQMIGQPHEYGDRKIDKRFAVSREELQRDCEGNEDLVSLYETLIDNSIRYTESVWEFERIILSGGVDEELEEISKSRGRVHDATMDSINALARSLKKAGKNNAWISQIAGNRAAYGKFAIVLACDYLKNQEV